MNQIKIKFPYSSEQLYGPLLVTAKFVFWFFPLLICLFAIHYSVYNNRPIQDQIAPIFFILCLIYPFLFLFKFLTNKYFNEYLLISDEIVIVLGPKIDGHSERRFNRENIKKILWEKEKPITGLGNFNKIYFIDESAKSYCIYNGNYPTFKNRLWESFLENISNITGAPIETKIYALSPDLKERHEIEKQSDGIGSHKKLSQFYKLYLICLGAIPFILSFISISLYSLKYFVILGVISVLCCLCLTLILFFSTPKDENLYSANKLFLIAAALTLKVSFFTIYTVFYVFFAFILGKQIPI